MNDRDHGARRVVRGLRLRMAASLAVVAVLVITGAFIMHRDFDRSAEAAHIVDQSGRQRMLLQRGALLSMELAEADEPGRRTGIRNELGATADRMLHSHQRLAEIAHSLDVSPEMMTALGDLEQRVRAYCAGLRDLAGGAGAVEPDDPRVQAAMAAAHGPLRVDLEELVTGFANTLEAKQRALQRLEWVIAALLTLAAALSWILVVRPTLRRVSDGVRELADLNEQLEDRVRVRSAAAVERAEQLAESEARLQAHAALTDLILATMREGVLLIGPDGTVRIINEAGREVFDLSVGDPAHTRLRDLQWRTASGEERTTAAAVPLLAGGALEGGGSNVIDALQLSADHLDRDVWLAVQSTVVPVEDGRGVLCVVRDITERVDAEDRLRHGQKMESIGRLTGGLAHDFNNLLTVIVSQVDMIGDMVEGDSPVHEELQLVSDAAARAADTVGRLLAYGRRQNLRPKAVNVNEVIRDLEPLVRRALGDDIKIDIRRSDDLWPAVVDPHEFESVLLNLLANARDAMPDGGNVVIETENRHLDEDYAEVQQGLEPGDYAMVAVTDTGEGIPAEDLQRVFEPYYTTKPASVGSIGLGLSVAYGFVTQSGGHIQAYSEPGQGTTIKVYLPRAEDGIPVADTGRPTADADEPRGDGRAVLLVEDDDAVRAVTYTMLQRLGYRVREASSARQALETAASWQDMEILFTDISLPGSMNGVELADRLRKEHPGLHVLLATGYTEGVTRERGAVRDDWELLSKPFSRRELAHALQRAVQSVRKPADH